MSGVPCPLISRRYRHRFAAAAMPAKAQRRRPHVSRLLRHQKIHAALPALCHRAAVRRHKAPLSAAMIARHPAGVASTFLAQMETHQPVESAVCDSAFCSCFVPYSIFHGCGVSFFYPEVVWDNIGRQPEGLCAQIYRKAPESADEMLEPFSSPDDLPGPENCVHLMRIRTSLFPIIGHAFACAGDFFVQRGRII
jgi:hypothetical protein